MGQGGESLKWGVERRLEFIEFRLFWDGGVNRADIVNMFDVSVPQASKDLTLYQERAPHNAIYDKSAKRYVAGAQFQPSFLRPDPAAYLNQLRSVAEGILAPSHAWIGQFPSYDATPTPVRGVKTETLRSITAAIRLSEAIWSFQNAAARSAVSVCCSEWRRPQRADPEPRASYPSIANGGFCSD